MISDLYSCKSSVIMNSANRVIKVARRRLYREIEFSSYELIAALIDFDSISFPKKNKCKRIIEGKNCTEKCSPTAHQDMNLLTSQTSIPLQRLRSHGSFLLYSEVSCCSQLHIKTNSFFPIIVIRLISSAQCSLVIYRKKTLFEKFESEWQIRISIRFRTFTKCVCS